MSYLLYSIEMTLQMPKGLGQGSCSAATKSGRRLNPPRLSVPTPLAPLGSASAGRADLLVWVLLVLPFPVC